jgi:hypothetical protein
MKLLGSYGSTYFLDYTVAGEGMQFSTKLHGITSQDTAILIISVDIAQEREVNPSFQSII